MNRKIFSVFLGLCAVFFSITASLAILQAQSNRFPISGSFILPTSWQGSNAEKVIFPKGEDFAGSNDNDLPRFDENGVFNGNLWLGTAGWATFSHGEPSQTVKMNCPNDILHSTLAEKTTVCYFSGAVWSQSSGWIFLDKDVIGAGSGVYFNPNSANIEGFGWSQSLGWIPFFSGEIFNERDKTNVSGTTAITSKDWYQNFGSGNTQSLTGLGINFIGKVAIIGHSAGTKVFSAMNLYNYQLQDVGNRYEMIQHSPLLNMIRGTVAQMTRNLDKTQPKFFTEKGFVYNENKDFCFTKSTTSGTHYCKSGNTETILDINFNRKIDNPKIKTIIVKGHDVILDDNFNTDAERDKSKMKAIIALKGPTGNGGNVIITKNVEKIYAYIVAEGSVFSGEKTSTGITHYIDNKNKSRGLPQKRLYINGLLISKNTIGGNAGGNPDGTLHYRSKCPILVDCGNEPEKYDLSYFRLVPLDKNEGLPQKFQDASNAEIQKIKEQATVIIDYNSEIQNNPPPGLEAFR